MILRILRAELDPPHRLRLSFSDGIEKTVDVRPLLSGSVFEPLLDPAYFARFELDLACGTWFGQTARTSPPRRYASWRRKRSLRPHRATRSE